MYPELEENVLKYINATKKDLALFYDILKPKQVPAKSFLITPDTKINHNYFVLKGCLKAYYMDTKGDIHVIQFAIENWWVSDFEAFYQNQDTKLHIETIEDSTLVAVTREDLEILFAKAPIFERYFRILNTNSFIAQQKRILSSLEKNTKERYLEFCASFPNIENRVQNYHIANYLGVSAERLSRIRRTLKD